MASKTESKPDKKAILDPTVPVVVEDGEEHGTLSAPALAAHLQNHPDAPEGNVNPLARSEAQNALDAQKARKKGDEPRLTEQEWRSDNPGEGPPTVSPVVPEKGPDVKGMMKRLLENTGCDRDELIDRLLIATYSEGWNTSRDEMLAG